MAVANSQKRIGERTEQYAYLHLMALIVPAFVRFYGSLAGARKPLLLGARRHVEGLPAQHGRRGVVRNFSSQLDGRQSLTCSEFVYRCYTEFSSPYGVEVLEPVVPLEAAQAVQVGGP